jgi:hypothetical protein
MSSDLIEKKFKLAAEQPIPQPPDLDKLAFFLQGSDDLLRDDVLGNRVREFREALDERFKGTNSEVYATVDKDWIQFYLFDLGWNVYYDVIRDHYWGYREKDKEPACNRYPVEALLEVIERIKDRDDDNAYGVHRASLWAAIARTVTSHFGLAQRHRVRYRLKNDTADENEENAIVFTLDGKWTFEASQDGTFSCPGLASGTLEQVLGVLQDPEKQAIRTKIQFWKEELKEKAADKEFWGATFQTVCRLQELLAKKCNPSWGPDTNTRGFYFGLDTLRKHAKEKADLPVPSLEKAAVNDCLKEMADLPTPEIVKKLELVSQLVKEDADQQ